MRRITALIFIFLFASMIYAQQDGIIVTGFGETPEDAKRNAFVNAIEQSIGVMVSSDIMVDNGELIRDRIRSNTQGYIESYSIISSGKDGKLFVVTIKAVVAKNKILSQIEEITHVNDARLSYEATECAYTGFKSNIMCNGGDIAMGNMNFGIHDDSFARLRQFRGDIIETQLYFRITLRENGGFYEVTDENNNKLELKRVYSQDDNSRSRTVTEDLLIVVGQEDLSYLKDFIRTGMELKLTGRNKQVDIKIPGAYIEGFVKRIEEEFK